MKNGGKQGAALSALLCRLYAEEMVKTCDDFAKPHDLTFSTNFDYRKCKTKGLAFLNNSRNQRNIQLGNWVTMSSIVGGQNRPHLAR